MENKYRVVASQDECAPDSSEYFKKDFERIVGQDFEQWKQESVKTLLNDAYTVIYTKGDFRIVCDAGEPWWKLEQLIPQPTIIIQDGNKEENI